MQGFMHCTNTNHQTMRLSAKTTQWYSMISILTTCLVIGQSQQLSSTPSTVKAIHNDTNAKFEDSSNVNIVTKNDTPSFIHNNNSHSLLLSLSRDLATKNVLHRSNDTKTPHMFTTGDKANQIIGRDKSTLITLINSRKKKAGRGERGIRRDKRSLNNDRTYFKRDAPQHTDDDYENNTSIPLPSSSSSSSSLSLIMSMNLTNKGHSVRVSWATNPLATASNQQLVQGFVVSYRMEGREDYDSSRLGKTVRSFLLHNLHEDVHYRICVQAIGFQPQNHTGTMNLSESQLGLASPCLQKDNIPLEENLMSEMCLNWSKTSMKLVMGVIAGLIFLAPCIFIVGLVVYKDRQMTTTDIDIEDDQHRNTFNNPTERDKSSTSTRIHQIKEKEPAANKPCPCSKAHERETIQELKVCSVKNKPDQERHHRQHESKNENGNVINADVLSFEDDKVKFVIEESDEDSRVNTPNLNIPQKQIIDSQEIQGDVQMNQIVKSIPENHNPNIPVLQDNNPTMPVHSENDSVHELPESIVIRHSPCIRRRVVEGGDEEVDDKKDGDGHVEDGGVGIENKAFQRENSFRQNIHH